MLDYTFWVSKSIYSFDPLCVKNVNCVYRLKMLVVAMTLRHIIFASKAFDNAYSFIQLPVGT